MHQTSLELYKIKSDKREKTFNETWLNDFIEEHIVRKIVKMSKNK